MQISADRVLPVPPAAAFTVFTDFAARERIFTGIETIETITTPPLRLKSRFFETRSLFGQRGRVKLMVVELAPPHHILLETRAVGVRFTLGMDFEPLAGGCRARLTVGAEPETLKGRLALVFMAGARGAITEVIARDLADGAAEIERRLSGGARGAGPLRPSADAGLRSGG